MFMGWANWDNFKDNGGGGRWGILVAIFSEFRFLQSCAVSLIVFNKHFGDRLTFFNWCRYSIYKWI